MGNELRSGEVTTATDPSRSMRATAHCAMRARADDAAGVLKEIEDYNVYDCRSTRRLRDWMMAARHRMRRPPRGPHRCARATDVLELGDDLEAHTAQVRG